MSIKPPTTDRTERPTDTPRITRHAAERYRQRIDAAEPFPRAKLEELVETAEPTGDHPRVTNGIAWVAGDAILVTDTAKEAVKTVLRRWEGR
jgi:hypothetical protein